MQDHETHTRPATRFRRHAWLVGALALVVSLSTEPRAGLAQQSDGRPRRTETQQKEQKDQTARPAPLIKVDEEPPPMPKPKLKDQEPQGQEVSEDEKITIDTSLVRLNVRVIDRQNRPVSDVRQDEFRVFEDGVPQTISSFTKEEVPISYGLVIDNSGSLRSQIDKVIEAGKAIVNDNKPGDETFLVRFVDSENIETVQDFTANKAALLDALDSLYIQGGQTAVIDAVYLSAERVAQYKKGDDNDRRRRVLILVTDGEDRNSYYKQEQLFARLREDDVQIYVIGFVKELDKEGGLISKSPREKAMNLLSRLAKETGGRVFFPESTAELPKIAEEITRDMRTQYVIGYSPTNKAHDGTYRTVRVTVADAPGRDKRIAITRPGYIASRDGAPAPKTPAGTKPVATRRSSE
jgi:Ca-activated chloride channel family protein